MRGTISKYKTKKGIAWQYEFKMNGQRYHKRGFNTRDAAGEALDAAIAEGPVTTEARTPSEEPETEVSRRQSTTSGSTVKEYLSYWLENHAVPPRCAPSTVELYGKLAVHLVRYLGKIRLRDLKAAHIQEMVNQLQVRGGVKSEKHPQGRPLSAKWTHAVASMLNTCLSDAVRLEHLAVNPMAGRRVKLPKRPKPRPAVLDPGMLAKLFAIAEGKRIYPLLVFAAASGTRRGELCALTWDDIDFETGTATISKSLEQTRKGGLRVKSTKSGEPRLIGLDEFVLEVLEVHRQQQAEDKRNFGVEYQDHGLVFCQPNGYFYSPNNVGCGAKELLAKADLKQFSLHSLRHSHASVLLSNGVPIPVVSERLGHADQTITLQVYSHSLPCDRRGAANAWRNALAEAIQKDRSSRSTPKPERVHQKQLKIAVND